MKKIYRFYVDCGRMGELEGVFAAEEANVLASHGKTVYFHDVLGKHSEIDVELSEDNISEIDATEEEIGIICNILGNNISGINPLDYIYDE